jgi:hypothetical protein
VVLLAVPYDCGPVETVILFEDPFVVALPHAHPLAKESGVKPERLWREHLMLLKDGHCLRDHALSACHLADGRGTEGFEATSLPTLVQMVDKGSARRYCQRSQSTQAYCLEPASSPDRCSAMSLLARLASFGAAAPGGERSFICLRKSSRNVPGRD